MLGISKRPLMNATRFVRINRLHTSSSRMSECSASFAQEKPVDLEFDAYPSPDGNTTKGPLVILHGLLGSKRNWASLSKTFAASLHRPVYAVDLRNHGHSPAASPHTYPAMSMDIHHFLRKHDLNNVQLLGHSMGGKVAMSYALSEEAEKDGRLEKLVVADIAPSQGRIGQEFTDYVKAMKEIGERGLNTRKEAQHALSQVEPDPAVLAFLMTNLVTSPEGARFRLPLDILLQHVPDIGGFPFTPGQRTWDGPTLFVKGKKSPYINHKNIPLTQQLFPNSKIEQLDAGHWVHAERPHEFKQLLIDFLGKAGDA